MSYNRCISALLLAALVLGGVAQQPLPSCPYGKWGTGCTRDCPGGCNGWGNEGTICDVGTGVCLQGCQAGLQGQQCNKACPLNQHCAYPEAGCNVDGSCDYCDNGWFTKQCNRECPKINRTLSAKAGDAVSDRRYSSPFQLGYLFNSDIEGGALGQDFNDLDNDGDCGFNTLGSCISYSSPSNSDFRAGVARYLGLSNADFSYGDVVLFPGSAPIASRRQGSTGLEAAVRFKAQFDTSVSVTGSMFLPMSAYTGAGIVLEGPVDRAYGRIIVTKQDNEVPDEAFFEVFGVANLDRDLEFAVTVDLKKGDTIDFIAGQLYNQGDVQLPVRLRFTLTYSDNGNRCYDQRCMLNDGLCDPEVNCMPGYFTPRCNRPCPGQCGDGRCNVLTGDCDPEVGCFDGFYGAKCNKVCPANCVAPNGLPVCDRNSGDCTLGCKPGFWGKRCTATCGFCQQTQEFGLTPILLTSAGTGYNAYSNPKDVSSYHFVCRQSDGQCDGCQIGYWKKGCTAGPVRFRSERCTAALRPPVLDRRRTAIDGNINQNTGVCEACVENLYWDPLCNSTCSENCGNTYESPVDGSCQNDQGFSNACSKADGSCLFGSCNAVNQFTFHDRTLTEKHWGAQCENLCSPYCSAVSPAADYTAFESWYGCCSNSDGTCSNGCIVGLGVFGAKCDKICDTCVDKQCTSNGTCIVDCVKGYWGATCNNSCWDTCKNWKSNYNCDRATGQCTWCEYDTWGPYCEKACPANCAGKYPGDPRPSCDRVQGTCNQGCRPGSWGPKCEKQCKGQYDDQLGCDQSTGEDKRCAVGYTGRSCNRQCRGHCAPYWDVKRDLNADTDSTNPFGYENGWTAGYAVIPNELAIASTSQSVPQSDPGFTPYDAAIEGTQQSFTGFKSSTASQLCPQANKPGWNFAADFTTAQNPNGPWSYGWATQIIYDESNQPTSDNYPLWGDFQYFDITDDSDGIISWRSKASFRSGPPDTYMGVVQNVNQFGYQDVEPGHAGLYPGCEPNREVTIVQFTVPQGGVYRLYGAAYSGDYGVTSFASRILYPDGSQKNSAWVTLNQTWTFDKTTEDLPAGTILQIAVGSTSQNCNGDMTQLDWSVSRVSGGSGPSSQPQQSNSCDPDFAVPNLWRNTGSSRLWGLNPTQVGLHPGCNGEVSFVRFTAPRDGVYSFDIEIDFGDVGQKSLCLRIYSTAVGYQLACQVLPVRSLLRTYGASLPLSAGGYLDIGIGAGNDGCFSDTGRVSVRAEFIGGIVVLERREADDASQMLSRLFESVTLSRGAHELDANTPQVASCNIDTGLCAGECQVGWFRSDCSRACPATCGNYVCDKDSGVCTSGCVAGYWGDRCNRQCAAGCSGGVCDKATGSCTCSTGFYGASCRRLCPSGCGTTGCDVTTGSCTNGCDSPTKYGTRCDRTCSSGCVNGQCNQDGSCTCQIGKYGAYCDKTCSNRCTNGCVKATGACNPAQAP